MQIRLEVSRADANVRTLVVKSDVLIGRSAECNLRIACSEVSRRHCRLRLTENGVLVRDLRSSNGTFVDGRLIDPETDVPLAPGSRLSLGGVDFLVRFELSSDTKQSVPDGAGCACATPRGRGGFKSLLGVLGLGREGSPQAETTELPVHRSEARDLTGPHVRP
jgi:predicted component of type VI protein secretion system